MDLTAEHKNVRLRCMECAATFPFGFMLRCPICNGLVDPIYDLDHFVIRESLKPLVRYFDLVPLEHISSVLHVGEGNTPCVHAQALGTRWGLAKLYLKNETVNATGSTKDRMAMCVLSQFRELQIREFVASSTGNSSTAFAYGVQFIEDMHLHLFSARDFIHRHAYCDHPRISLHIVDGDFVAAGRAAQEFARTQGIAFEGGFFNLARREGLKLAYLEAFDQLAEEPAVVVQAVSSGMGMYGAYKGAHDYKRIGRIKQIPRLVCAQQDTCAPMVTAFADGSPTIRSTDIVPHPYGLAEAILRGDPSQAYPYLYRIVRATAGTFVSVSQDAIIEAQQTLLELEGIDACYASATALAAVRVLASAGWIKESEVVLVNLTGGMQRPTAGRAIGPQRL